MHASPDSSKIGFGTYPLKNEQCFQSVKTALQSGYQVIDTATYYENFDAIAKAIKDQDRQKIYIISKVWHDQQEPENLRKDLFKTLRELEVDYLDAYLLHWPNHTIPIDQTLMAMEELRNEGKIRHIGLSNVSINHLKRALEYNIPIRWVQVQMSPDFCDFELLQFCKEHSMVIQAWGPLGFGGLSEDPMLTEIGEKHHKTACQVALKWIVQHGCMPLPGSKNSAHIKANIDIFDFTLSEEEMAIIDSRAKSGKRFRLTEEEQFGFTDEFDLSYNECWPKK